MKKETVLWIALLTVSFCWGFQTYNYYSLKRLVEEYRTGIEACCGVAYSEHRERLIEK